MLKIFYANVWEQGNHKHLSKYSAVMKIPAFLLAVTLSIF